MAIKHVVLLGFVLLSVLLFFQDVAYARELTQANGGSGLKDEKLTGVGYINAGGYFGNGYGGGYGIGFGGGVPPVGFGGPGYGSFPFPFYPGGYAGDYGPPVYPGGYGGDYGQPVYGGGPGN